jgi:predicted nuclease of predicted toxin-antitoxin system
MYETTGQRKFSGRGGNQLRNQGHDVKWIREDSPGSSDSRVLELAQKEGRILITFDKDFGELAFRFGLPSSCGIVLFRISMPSAKHIAQVATTIFSLPRDWKGYFSVIENDRIRMTELPKSR